MVDVSPFKRKTRKGVQILVLNPSVISNPIDSTIGSVAYEIHDGAQIVTRIGVIFKDENSIAISSITKIDEAADSLTKQLATLGTKNLTFHLTGGGTEIWRNVPSPSKVKRLIDKLRQHGPEYLTNRAQTSQSKEIVSAQLQQPSEYVQGGEILPPEEMGQPQALSGQVYNDHSDKRVHNGPVIKGDLIKEQNIHNGHNFYVADDTALRTDLDGNPLVVQGEYDPKVGANIAAAKKNPDDKDKATTSRGTLQHFKKIVDIPAGFPDFEDTEKGVPVTEILFTPEGYLLTSTADGELKQAWDIVTGKPVQTTLDYVYSPKFETTTFYDGRHKTITLKEGKIHMPYDSDYSILTGGAWVSIQNKELTQIAGAINGSRTRLIAASDRQGKIHVTHTTLAQKFNIEITKHGLSNIVYLNWAGPKYQGTSQQLPKQSWLTTHLTSASLDGTIRVWDVENEQELGCFMGHDVANPAIAENDTHFVYADQHGYVHVFERLER